MSFFSQPDYPDFYADYLSAFKHRVSRKTPIEDLSFVVLDTETTGLNIQEDQIISIGLVEVQGNSIDLSRSWEVLVKPDPNLKPKRKFLGNISLSKKSTRKGSIQIHGIRKVDAASGMEINDALSSLLSTLKSKIIVGHHISFDINMIDQALKRAGAGKLKNHFIDTVQLARRLENPLHLYHQESQPYYSLDDLCRNYNIIMHDRHTALGDAYLTALLFLKMLVKLKKKQVKTLKDLLRP